MIERAGQWIRANARHAPAAAVVPAVVLVFVSVWLVVHSLVLTLVLGSLLTAVLACIWAFIAFAAFDARPIAREVLAKKHDVTVPTRTVRTYEVEPNHQAVPQLPASTYRMDPTPAYPVDVDDPNVPIRVDVAPARLPVVNPKQLQAGHIRWPNIDAARLSILNPIPLGVDIEGGWVLLSLLWQNLLVGGIPGFGKSVLLSIIAATVALDPRAKLTLFDAQRVDMSFWKGSATHFVGNDMAEAIRTLDLLIAEVDRRAAWLEKHGQRKLDPTGDMPVWVVVMDEAAWYFTHPDKDAAKALTTRMTDLVARGRKVGMPVVLATQQPYASIIPGTLRNLFSCRLAYRTTTSPSSDTILGDGMAKQGFSSFSQPPLEPGEGFLVAGSDEPRRFHTCFLTDDDVKVLATRAEALRRSASRSAYEAPSEAGPKRGASGALLSVDEALRELSEAQVGDILAGYARGESEYSIARGVLDAPRGGDGLTAAIALCRAVKDRGGPASPVLKIVKDAGEEA